MGLIRLCGAPHSRIKPTPENDNFPALWSGGEVVLEVTPAAVVTTEACDADEDMNFALRIWSETEALLRSEDTGAITIDRDLRDYEGQPAELRLEACEDTSDYRDSSVTLAFVAASLETTEGTVTAGPHPGHQRRPRPRRGVCNRGAPD